MTTYTAVIYLVRVLVSPVAAIKLTLTTEKGENRDATQTVETVVSASGRDYRKYARQADG